MRMHFSRSAVYWLNLTMVIGNNINKRRFKKRKIKKQKPVVSFQFCRYAISRLSSPKRKQKKNLLAFLRNGFFLSIKIQSKDFLSNGKPAHSLQRQLVKKQYILVWQVFSNNENFFIHFWIGLCIPSERFCRLPVTIRR